MLNENYIFSQTMVFKTAAKRAVWAHKIGLSEKKSKDFVSAIYHPWENKDDDYDRPEWNGLPAVTVTVNAANIDNWAEASEIIRQFEYLNFGLVLFTS